MCDLPVKGARNAIGSIKGMRNDDNLNGSAPALLVALRCNSDVSVPYRIPVTTETHCDHLCERSDCCDVKDADIVYAAQVAQDSQCGYACDYANKRGPIAVNEAKEMYKGLTDLGSQLRESSTASSVPYTFHRYRQRLMSDTYGKACTRAAVETSSLLTNSRKNNVIAAETIIAGPI